MTVIKRDGRKKAFDKKYIYEAIMKAMRRTEKGQDADLAIEIAASIEGSKKDVLAVEEIQDMVVDRLINSSRQDVGVEYIEYRKIRSERRHQIKNLDTKIGSLIDMTDDDVINENANKDSDVFNTQRDLLAGIVAKDYAQRYLMPKDVIASHNKGNTHYHDLDYSPFFGLYNCMLIDFKGMFKRGFTIGNADIESPKNIKTAAALIAQIVANVSSNIYGGTTCANIDLLLEPYGELSYNKYIEDAKRFNIPNPDKYATEKTKKEVYDAMQSLEYEINTLYNSNGQLAV